MRNFLSTAELRRDELEAIVESALRFKAGTLNERPLEGQSVALVFFNPSLRTRASMQVGIYELGGNPVILEPGGSSWSLESREGVIMDGDKTEHLKEFVRVLERYVSVIGVRCFAELHDWYVERRDPVLNAFAGYADVPVINLESAMHHPCQAMADMMTIRERFGTDKKKVLLTWAWHPKPLPMAVPNSFALAAAQFGHDLRIAHPSGYELDDELFAEIEANARRSGGSVEVTTNVHEAFDGVDVVYAKSWGSKSFYGAPGTEIAFRANMRGSWMISPDYMAQTNNAVFMHCLPVRRNVVVSDEVIDGPNSAVIDEAENRLHVQKAILAELTK